MLREEGETMPEQMSAMVESVEGPNERGWFTIYAGGKKLSTKKVELAQMAAQYRGQIVLVGWSEKTNESNGRVYTNTYLESVQSTPLGATTPQQQPLAQPLAAAPRTVTPSDTDRDRQASIEKQKALALASELSDFRVKIESVEQYLSLAEIIYAHLQRDWGESQVADSDSDIPF
jgi:hypothetical protein